MLRIARANVLPPGGYSYRQPETGMEFDGNTLFRAQARQIATHRKANGLPRSTVDEASEDLMAYTCARVPGVCTDLSGPLSQAVPGSGTRRVRKCGSCGGRKKK